MLVSALVRTGDPQPPPQPPTLNLNPLPGDQYAATLRAAPTALPHLSVPARELNGGEPLDIPIGATGILVGAARYDDPAADPPVQADDLVMLSLTDPDRATRISMQTSDFYVRQLLIRAAAVGERIAIYSHQPDPVEFVDAAQHRRGRTTPAAAVRPDHHGQRPAHRAGRRRAVGHCDHAGRGR